MVDVLELLVEVELLVVEAVVVAAVEEPVAEVVVMQERTVCCGQA
jgi:hypothetical protein